MKFKSQIVALSLLAATIGFSPFASAATPPATLTQVSIASANSSTPATYDVPDKAVATLIYARTGTKFTITVNGIASSEYFSSQLTYLPSVVGPAAITLTSGDVNGAVGTIVVTPLAKTTTQPLPR